MDCDFVVNVQGMVGWYLPINYSLHSSWGGYFFTVLVVFSHTNETRLFVGVDGSCHSPAEIGEINSYGGEVGCPELHLQGSTL